MQYELTATLSALVFVEAETREAAIAALKASVAAGLCATLAVTDDNEDITAEHPAVITDATRIA